MISTDTKIARYKEVYHDLHGSYPTIEKNGSWIYVNGGPSAYRAKDLPQMANQLKENIRRRIRIRNPELAVPVEEAIKVMEAWTLDEIEKPKLWKKYIKKDLIELYFQRLYEDCHNSPFDMERAMKDYALGGVPYNDNRDCDPTECDYIREQESIVEDMESTLDRALEKQRSLQNVITNLKRSLKEECETSEKLALANKLLKENSVLFTMDDLKVKQQKIMTESDYTHFDHEDDDVPF